MKRSPAAIKKFGIDPSEVEQIVVLFRMVDRTPGTPAAIAAS